MASEQPDESSFTPASLELSQKTDFEEADASTSQYAFANGADQHVHGLGILGTEKEIKRHEEAVAQLTNAQKWHNVLLGQIAELVKLQRARVVSSRDKAGVAAVSAAAAANTVLDEEVQQGSPFMVEGPSQGVVSPPLRSPVKAPATERQGVTHQESGPAKTALLTLSHFSDQMRWVEINLVKLWDRQIRESAMARRTLSSEYERLMAAMRQHADEHFGSEAAKPRGGPRITLQ
ncbi:hypothetical protein TWF679_007856 [Orbilia oligospora]|uniref:Uncharacterized protein n=1 Tax=Orbilia oligospora TaxID=2813651 RepID=A0A8H8V6D3_ORBOL|nr:hypothetical protein TWF679_007856 [Orbilia oligospora]